MPDEKILSFDELIDLAVVEGGKIKKKKKKKKEPSKLYAKAQIGPVGLGTFYRYAVVAQYTKRICYNCGGVEISAFPRMFLGFKATRDPSARKLEVLKNTSFIKHLLKELPLRTEMHPSSFPCCKFCIKEIKEKQNATRPAKERHESHQGPDTTGAIPPHILPVPGTLQA